MNKVIVTIEFEGDVPWADLVSIGESIGDEARKDYGPEACERDGYDGPILASTTVSVP